MSVWERLQNVDRRIIYVILAGVVFLALLKPMGLPIQISAETQKAYDKLESIPNGSIIWFSADFSASSGTELLPTMRAAMIQAFRKDLRIVCGAMWNEGGNLADRVWRMVSPMFPDKKYGVDFVNIGFRPGQAVWLESMVTDANAGALGQDHFGKPLADLPLMAEFKSLKDAKLIFDFISGDPGEKEYMARVAGPYSIPLVVSCVSVTVPEAMTFVQSGQVQGLVGGMAGAAQYEVLARAPGTAVSGMDAQSLAHIVVIAFIVLGNIGYLATKKK